MSDIPSFYARSIGERDAMNAVEMFFERGVEVIDRTELPQKAELLICFVNACVEMTKNNERVEEGRMVDR